MEHSDWSIGQYLFISLEYITILFPLCNNDSLNSYSFNKLNTIVIFNEHV